MKTRLISLSFSVIIIFSLVACAAKPAVETTALAENPTATSVPAVTLEPTLEPTLMPSYKGDFRDMTAQQLIAELGPGYSNSSLVHYDPFIGYDPYPSIPVYLNIGIAVQDQDEFSYSKITKLEFGKPVAFELSLKDLPNTPNGIKYNKLNMDGGVRSWQDVPMTIKIENARIELPDQTIEISDLNNSYSNVALSETRYNPVQDWLFVGLVGGGVPLTDLPATAVLKQGTFKADATLVEATGPTKADYYSDKGLREYEPELTSEWFQFLKSEGFNSIRFQVTWFNHTNDETYEIDQAWLNKVEDYINLALENDLYVSINLNWDMASNYNPGMSEEEIARLNGRHGWLTLDGDPKTEARFAAVWKQISEYFKDYDEHLIFEAMNEPMATDDVMSSLGAVNDPNGRGWSSIGGVADNLNRLNQIFVDSVRSAGGNSAKRFLFIPPFFEKANYLPAFKLPDDPEQHLVVSMNYYLGDDKIGGGDPFPNIQKYLLENNIPAVITEFGSSSEESSYEERVTFTRDTVTQAKALGVPIIWFGGNWGDHANDSPNFSLYNPFNLEKPFPELIDILMNKVQ